MKNYDLSFIGSGISSSFTILSLLDKLEANRISRKLKVALLEKSTEFFTGIPYGERSGSSVLLITSLQGFLPEFELKLFITWLDKNKHWLIKDFLNDGGVLSKKWVEKHQNSIDKNEWEELYIPRRFFGQYITEKISKKIDRLVDLGAIEIDFYTQEVKDIEKIKEGFLVKSDNNEILTKKVIMGIGSLPSCSIQSESLQINEDQLLFINNPYKPSLKSVLEEIKVFVNNRAEKPTNIAIIGANASGLELAYKVNDCTEIADCIDTYTMLSTQGLLPDSRINLEKQQKFKPKNLKALSSHKKLTAELVAEATYKDLDIADELELGPASTVGIISAAFGNLLRMMSFEERKRFACFFGNDIGRRQRCAGVHYAQVIEDLKKQSRFHHIAGRYVDLIGNSKGEYFLKYLDTKEQKEIVQEKPIHIVINCIKGMDLRNDKIPVLVKNIIERGYCKPNESNIGFDVNSSLEVYPHFHVVGPFLAGNVIDNNAVWHVEHCGRIIWLSSLLGNTLFDYFKNRLGLRGEKKEIDPNDYSISVSHLESQVEIEQYKKLVKQIWRGNIYYSYEHISHFIDKNSKLKCFLLKDSNGQPAVIMPFVLREVLINDVNTGFFDVVTPYGYSGPLLNDTIPSIVLDRFWELVDQWYMANGVITEFVRFSISNNHNYYSGQLIATLNNVRGKLLDNFSDQWDSFNRKVRNNYRKASAFGLKFEIYTAQQITSKIIEEFHKIYVNTMNRNNASSIYYFSEEYFENLISRNIDNFSLVIVYKDSKPISTELIIHQDDAIIAFLGGTDKNYFDCRPNDFLRVEVIKWAIKNGKSFYILGGGIKNGDGLYRHKKAMFPKDEDLIYYTGRKIINQAIYGKLCYRANQYFDEILEHQLKYHFFPFYRAEQLITSTE